MRAGRPRCRRGAAHGPGRRCGRGLGGGRAAERCSWHNSAPRVAAPCSRRAARPRHAHVMFAAPRGEGRTPWAPGAPTKRSSCSVPTRACRHALLRERAFGGELSRAMLVIPWHRHPWGRRRDPYLRRGRHRYRRRHGGGPRRASLARLAERRQVLCITDLPQVAVFAERQFAIVKESDPAAGSTVTVVRRVEGDDRLAELCRMLGAAPSDSAARSHVQGLRAAN